MQKQLLIVVAVLAIAGIVAGAFGGPVDRAQARAIKRGELAALSSESVTSNEVADGTIRAAEMAPGTITSNQVNLNAAVVTNSWITGDSKTVTVVTAGVFLKALSVSE